jgi:hypothetical protein
MAQGVLGYKYEQEKKDTGMTSLSGLPLRVHCRMAAPACHPCYPGSPSIGSGSYR